MMNQRHETPSDKSENDINLKIGSGLKGKRWKGIRFKPIKRHGIAALKCITTHINDCPSNKYVVVRNKDESEAV